MLQQSAITAEITAVPARTGCRVGNPSCLFRVYYLVGRCGLVEDRLANPGRCPVRRIRLTFPAGAARRRRVGIDLRVGIGFRGSGGIRIRRITGRHRSGQQRYA